MTDAERDKLDARFWELEKLIQAIDAGRITTGDPQKLRGECLLEQDEIEYHFGIDYFERRDSGKE